MSFALIIPAFIAGLLIFFAPCTFPLVPGYLAFIGGASLASFKDQATRGRVRMRVFLNGVFYVIGFSLVFIVLGSVFAGLGGYFLNRHRVLLGQIGGVVLILMGLDLMGVFHLVWPSLNLQERFPVFRHLSPGKPLSSFVFGASFAFGWTPCIGPILGSILLLASSY